MLTPAQQRAWQKVGRSMLPAHPQLPAWDETSAWQRIPALLQAAHPQDARDLQRVVRILAWLPGPLLCGTLALIQICSPYRWCPGPIRCLSAGLRGAVLGSYYAGLDRPPHGRSQVHAALDVALTCHPLNEEHVDD